MAKIRKCTMILISEGRRCHSQIALRYSSRSGFCLAFRTICLGSASGKLCRTQESGLGHGLFIPVLGGLAILLFGCRNSMHFVAVGSPSGPSTVGADRLVFIWHRKV